MLLIFATGVLAIVVVAVIIVACACTHRGSRNRTDHRTERLHCDRRYHHRVAFVPGFVCGGAPSGVTHTGSSRPTTNDDDGPGIVGNNVGDAGVTADIPTVSSADNVAAAATDRATTYGVGVTPSDVAVTPDGALALVTNSNSYGIVGSDTVTVLDLRRELPLKTIEDASFVEPYRVAIDGVGRLAYVCNSGSPSKPGEDGTLTVIDVAKLRVTGVITGFDGPGGIVLTPTRAYVVNYGANGGAKSGNGRTVSVVSLHKRRVIRTIEVPQAPAALALSECKERLYVVSYVDGRPGTGMLSIVNRKTCRIVASVAGLFGPFSLAVAPRTGLVYVTNFGSNDFDPYGRTVSVVDTRKNEIVATVETGIQPAAIAVSPDGRYAYVSNYNNLYAHANFADLTAGQGTLSRIRLRDNRLVAPTLAIGQTIGNLRFTPDGRRLLLCNYNPRTVTAFSVDDL